MASCAGFGLWRTLSHEKFAPVPLTGVSVNVSITDLVAKVTIVQKYLNVEPQPIEAVYKLRLDEGLFFKRFSSLFNEMFTFFLN